MLIVENYGERDDEIYDVIHFMMKCICNVLSSHSRGMCLSVYFLRFIYPHFLEWCVFVFVF